MGRLMDILAMYDERSSWSEVSRHKENERGLMRSMGYFDGSGPLRSSITHYEKCIEALKNYNTSGKEENWEPYIEKVIFNPPATIVFWKSGGKTVVKCNEPDKYDKAKGVALCYMKKALMNSSGEFNKQLRKAGVYYTEEESDI